MNQSTLKCSDARHLIHLSVGDDTRCDEEESLCEHLHVCSECRAYSAGMVDAMEALEHVRDAQLVEPGSQSMWPGLSRKLRSRGMRPRNTRKFNGGVVALCACSLSLALVTIVQSLPTNSPQLPGYSAQMPALNVAIQAGALGSREARQVQTVYGADGSVVGFLQTADEGVLAPVNTISSPETLDF